MTIHRLKLTERDHSRTERLYLPGMTKWEFETPIGNLSVSVHGKVYLRTKERTTPLTVMEVDALLLKLLHLNNVARNQLRIREGVANDCEAVSGKSRLWRRSGSIQKTYRKHTKKRSRLGAFAFTNIATGAKCKRPVTPRKRSSRVSVELTTRGL